MNRAERRRAERLARRQSHYDANGHMGCGCSMRRIVPLETTDCPECGRPSSMFGPDGIDYPTASEVGTLSQMEIGCSCGAEYFVNTVVSA